MITAEMDHVEKHKVARNAAQTLGTRGLIAGGFARDVLFNKVPKDMDIWCPANAPLLDQDYYLNRAGQIMNLFGLEPKDEPAGQEYGQIGQNLVVFKSVPKEGSTPIDIIFDPGYTGRNKVGFVSARFDLDICKVIVARGQGVIDVGGAARAMKHGEPISRDKVLRFSLHGLINRIQHLREKYPEYWAKPVFDPIQPQLFGALYLQLHEGGVLGATGEILQEEAQEPPRDPVRLDAGERIQRLIEQYRKFQNMGVQGN